MPASDNELFRCLRLKEDIFLVECAGTVWERREGVFAMNVFSYFFETVILVGRSFIILIREFVGIFIYLYISKN